MTLKGKLFQILGGYLEHFSPLSLLDGHIYMMRPLMTISYFSVVPTFLIFWDDNSFIVLVYYEGNTASVK